MRFETFLYWVLGGKAIFPAVVVVLAEVGGVWIGV
jgi:hypothetical protein